MALENGGECCCLWTSTKNIFGSKMQGGGMNDTRTYQQKAQQNNERNKSNYQGSAKSKNMNEN